MLQGGIVEVTAAAGEAASTPQPDKVAKFEISEGDAPARFQGWLKGSIFSPKGIASRVRTEQWQGVFVPVYDCVCDVAVSARFVTKSQDLSEQERTLVDERLSWCVTAELFGRSKPCFNIVVPASRAWDPATYVNLSPFKLNAAVALSPGASPNAAGEPPAFDSERAQELALTRMAEIAGHRLATAREIAATMHVDIVATHRLITCVYLPIWRWLFSYNERQYSAMMNGQTGKIHGSKPGLFG